MAGTTGKKVLKHPAKDQIDERLLAGESVDKVAAWIRQKYPQQKKFHINKMTLQAYRNNYLNLEGEVLADIQRERRDKRAIDRQRLALERRKSSETFQISKVRIAEQLEMTIVDTKNQLQTLFENLSERIEIMQSQKVSHLNEKVIVDQMRLFKDLIEEVWKMERKMKEDSGTTIGIDAEKAQKQMKAMKSAIKDTFLEIAPELLQPFVQRLAENIGSISFEDDDPGVTII